LNDFPTNQLAKLRAVYTVNVNRRSKGIIYRDKKSNHKSLRVDTLLQPLSPTW